MSWLAWCGGVARVCFCVVFSWGFSLFCFHFLGVLHCPSQSPQRGTTHTHIWRSGRHIFVLVGSHPTVVTNMNAWTLTDAGVDLERAVLLTWYSSRSWCWRGEAVAELRSKRRGRHRAEVPRQSSWVSRRTLRPFIFICRRSC